MAWQDLALRYGEVVRPVVCALSEESDEAEAAQARDAPRIVGRLRRHREPHATGDELGPRRIRGHPVKLARMGHHHCPDRLLRSTTAGDVHHETAQHRALFVVETTANGGVRVEAIPSALTEGPVDGSIGIESADIEPKSHRCNPF
jgi:hypothetical protein